MSAEELFKKLFPHLTKEMEEGTSKVEVDEFKDEKEREQRGTSRMWAGYDPDIVDFIRRCENAEQAEEIIEYIEKRGEITNEQAAELSRQLQEKGLESFGSRKEEGFYHKDG